MIRFYLQISLLLLVTLAAWKFGRKAERHVSAIYCGLVFGGLVYAIWTGAWADYQTFPMYRLVLDVAAFALVLRLALHAQEWWVIWVASAQMLAVAAHVMEIVGIKSAPLVYAVMERWPIWLAILLTGYGTLRTFLQRRRA